MRRVALMLAVFAMCAAAVAALFSPSRAAELVPFYTPPAGGGAYIIGAGIVSLTNKYTDISLVHEATTGTMDIVRRMMQREGSKKDAFGVFGTVDGWNAFKGNNEYKGRPFGSLRMVVFVNDTDVYLVVPADSPIKSYADVRGKRIGMNGPGSTVANTALFLPRAARCDEEGFQALLFYLQGIGRGD